ncbi:nucleotide exchange factor GrpE [Corynebacterium argentoratense]|uniref:nucleotide exchange factor GrpE n=1 Tax=Corynebacterium argentoratense TaxID=42817 RepID=UPI002DD41C18|nr:nucleotide exchange factor GrpE [Corynebacterium argentoratense]
MSDQHSDPQDPQGAADGFGDDQQEQPTTLTEEEVLAKMAEQSDSEQPDDDAASVEEPVEGTAEPDVAQQLAERTEDLQRVTAEYANFRRRTERDRAAVVDAAKASVVAELLAVVDDLELAEKHGDLQGPLKAVNDKIRATFTKLDVIEFGAEGDEFDPERHEAVQDTSTGETKVIGTVLRSGWAMGDRLIRTAMVIIADPA